VECVEEGVALLLSLLLPLGGRQGRSRDLCGRVFEEEEEGASHGGTIALTAMRHTICIRLQEGQCRRCCSSHWADSVRV